MLLFTALFAHITRQQWKKAVMRKRTFEVQLWILIWKLGFVRRRRRRRPIFAGGEIMSVAVFCHSPLCASASPSRLPVVIGPVVSVCLLPCFVVLRCCTLLCIVVLFCAALLWGETHCARWWASESAVQFLREMVEDESSLWWELLEPESCLVPGEIHWHHLRWCSAQRVA